MSFSIFLFQSCCSFPSLRRRKAGERFSATVEENLTRENLFGEKSLLNETTDKVLLFLYFLLVDGARIISCDALVEFQTKASSPAVRKA